MKKNALITGATSGIGRATALNLAKHHFNLIITGRRRERLEELEREIRQIPGAETLALCFDIRDREETERQLRNIGEAWKRVDLLVNNAGLAAGLDPVHRGDPDNWEKMIDTNIKGLLYITRIVSDWMAARNSGHIVNIGSIAGKEVYENGNVYCATKHAVDALNRSMRIDLLKYNIRVTCIAPGMVETEFSLIRFGGDRKKADEVYSEFTPLTAEDIAEAILFAATRPPHVNINDMLIMPTAQADAAHLNKKQS